jgi:hypothetical protein
VGLGGQAGRAALAGIAGLALAVTPTVASGASAPGIGGNPAGVRLARQVDAAYHAVPWLSGVGTVTTSDGRRVIVRSAARLRNGLIVAHIVRGAMADGSHPLVNVLRGRFLYERRPPARCWTRTVLAPSKRLPQPFFTTSGERYDAPRRQGGRIVLTSTRPDGSKWRQIIRARDRHLLSGVGRDHGTILTLIVTEPRTPPSIPSTRPLC